ncbi:hypothetical protein GCM10011425_31550 [Mucilaginibacter galii]|uniref:Cytochrome c domain-containing protein n=1 Tax=Mucilaginibacter galii TaxID=2005073 RepID=A0A917JAU2_9SPHI|nr:hypothetical protein GCM10011425_31550 [Mucilaginibacter galii]
MCVLLITISCGQQTSSKKTITNRRESAITCSLNFGNGRNVSSTLGCINCHTYKNNRQAGTNNPAISFDDLADIDSTKIYKKVFTNKHKGMYAADAYFKKISVCDAQDMIYYIRHFDMPRYDVVPAKRHHQ